MLSENTKNIPDNTRAFPMSVHGISVSHGHVMSRFGSVSCKNFVVRGWACKVFLFVDRFIDGHVRFCQVCGQSCENYPSSETDVFSSKSIF